VLRAYALGFVSAAVAVLLVGVLWFGAQSGQDDGLLWGDKVYTSKQEFEGYLKSRGLSYKTWAARHDGAAPWEPDEINIGAITLRASTETREAWVVRLPLAALALMSLTGGALLLLSRLRSVMPELARRPAAFGSAVFTVLLVTMIWFGT
jgi:hypothetical protein